MWAGAAAAVDVLHAMFMAIWLLGLPLLFWRRFPGASRAYGVYAVVFVVVSRLSHWTFGECFLTTISRSLWQAGGPSAPGSDEWFTVRVAHLVFGMTPSHRVIAWLSEALVLVTAVGVLVTLRRRQPKPTLMRAGP